MHFCNLTSNSLHSVMFSMLKFFSFMQIIFLYHAVVAKPGLKDKEFFACSCVLCNTTEHSQHQYQ